MNFWFDPTRQVIINKVDHKNYYNFRWHLPYAIWWKP